MSKVMSGKCRGDSGLPCSLLDRQDDTSHVWVSIGNPLTCAGLTTTFCFSPWQRLRAAVVLGFVCVCVCVCECVCVLSYVYVLGACEFVACVWCVCVYTHMCLYSVCAGARVSVERVVVCSSGQRSHSGDC